MLKDQNGRWSFLHNNNSSKWVVQDCWISGYHLSLRTQWTTRLIFSLHYELLRRPANSLQDDLYFHQTMTPLMKEIKEEPLDFPSLIHPSVYLSIHRVNGPRTSTWFHSWVLRRDWAPQIIPTRDFKSKIIIILATWPLLGDKDCEVKQRRCTPSEE